MAKFPEIRFDFAAIVALESDGINLMGNDDRTKELLAKPSGYLALYRAGRLHEVPEFTREAALMELKEFSPKQIVEGITSAIQRDIGGEEETETSKS